MGAPDAIIGIAENFRACTAPDKVNVAIGAYRDDGGSPWVLPSVRTAEERLIARGEKKEYAGIAGLPAFLEKAMRFAYGQRCGWLPMPGALLDDAAQAARLVPPRAQAAPTHPRAPAEQLRRFPWPQQPASGRPKG